MQGTLKNPLYIRLHAGFTQWLGILNFEPTSPRDMPKMLTEFLLYLEAQNCDHPHDIQPDHLKKYLEYLHEDQARQQPVRSASTISGNTYR
jgi:integrase/recombinase XerD